MQFWFDSLTQLKKKNGTTKNIGVCAFIRVYSCFERCTTAEMMKKNSSPPTKNCKKKKTHRCAILIVSFALLLSLVLFHLYYLYCLYYFSVISLFRWKSGTLKHPCAYVLVITNYGTSLVQSFSYYWKVFTFTDLQILTFPDPCPLPTQLEMALESQF